MFLLVAKGYANLPRHPRVHTLITPSSWNEPGPTWAADNEVFVGFDPGRFRAMVERLPGTGCLFVTVPDVVGDHRATLRRWSRWRGFIDSWPAAFVVQDGCRVVPDDADALFVGGTTEWKLSAEARRLVDTFPGWRHMGRVNTFRRLRVARSWGIDSVDGTSMAMFTDRWVGPFLEATEHQQGSLL